MARPRKNPVQAPLREPMQTGRIQVVGRNGEVLTRKRTASTDPFHIPEEIIPEGYTYQWNTVTVFNEPNTAGMLTMAENGWRPVPAGRHKGMFMPADYPEGGEILRDGLRLEERPEELTWEAQDEERAKASRLVNDNLAQHRLVEKLPQGFTRNNQNLRRREQATSSKVIAPAPDIAAPRYEIDPAS